ncbi:hypothetical protein [Streptosporangium sp. G12]
MDLIVPVNLIPKSDPVTAKLGTGVSHVVGERGQQVGAFMDGAGPW